MIRVFARHTNATPIDGKAFYGPPPYYLSKSERHDDVCVSCTFTWDRTHAEFLAKQWEMEGYHVKLGGPAYNDPGEEFVPGRFLKLGYTITSRGCNNKCWFCYTWKREGNIRELPIMDGWRLLDSNILQCSNEHIKNVFAMLKRQPMPISILGGLESKLLKEWHIELLSQLTIARCYLAYDTPDDYEPLVKATKMIFDYNKFNPSYHNFLCYVLIGYPKDTYEKAELRLNQVLNLGLVPFAMLYRDDKGEQNSHWKSFQRQWARPTIIYSQDKPKEVSLFE